MAPPARPRRSVLYMPGSNGRALDKGRTLAADGLILDLEDSVSPDAKEEARDRVCRAAIDGGYGGREVLIRVNGLGTAWGRDDIVAAASSGADAIVLPKVDAADTVREADSIMDGAGAPASMALWCMMETPAGILHAEEIAAASRRVGGFALGMEDLVKDLHAAHTGDRLPVVTALGLCMLAARAAGIAILDGVHMNLDDDDGLEEACRRGREMGFDGKTLIHPKQIDAANRIFAPTADELDWSRRIIAAHGAAADEGQGVVVVDGRLVEVLHVAEAERLVAMAETIDERKGAK
ncbi:MAG: CoA ester lyase [Rhodospirillales bacterium]|jgi:citrate lyase subunit beta/citryl-CoA lyase|nr:CoA ester lyase [Rhodospirillales bacterium]MDP6883551.1 CoA ester lyase [Rhodospirillales bacterium]